MAVKQRLTIGEKVFEVRELTVTEVRDWLVSIENQTRNADPVGDFLFEDVGLSELAMMCDVDADEFASFRPSELHPLVQVAKELNPHFFRTRAVVSAALSSMISEILASDPLRSTAAASPLLPMGTVASGITPGASS